jgi:heme exporter protein B
MNDALNAARAVALRDLKRHLRRRQDLVQPVVFFVIVVTLFAIAVGPDAAIFAKIAPAGVWVAVLLATTINLDAMFLSDYQDGTIEQLLLSPAPLPLLVASKIFAHWCATAGPQIAISIVVAIVLTDFKPRWGYRERFDRRITWRRDVASTNYFAALYANANIWHCGHA